MAAGRCVAHGRGHGLRPGWGLDADTTIKPLYGHREGAELGYNPKKPGRPSHVYHSYMLANVRLVLDVEVMPGNKAHIQSFRSRIVGATRSHRTGLLANATSRGQELFL